MFLLYCLSLIEDQAQKTRFERMYYAHRHVMLYTAQHILKEQPLAEDAVQEAFLRVLHHMGKIDDPVSHKTRAFLVVIVRNISINLYNKRKRRNESAFDEGYVESDIWVEIPADPNNVVLEKLRELPALYAHTMALRYLYEFDDRECARLLNISEAAVRKRLERGRNLLKESLQKEAGYEYI